MDLALDHICGWKTPSGIVFQPRDCGACQKDSARCAERFGPLACRLPLGHAGSHRGDVFDVIWSDPPRA